MYLIIAVLLYSSSANFRLLRACGLFFSYPRNGFAIKCVKYYACAHNAGLLRRAVDETAIQLKKAIWSFLYIIR
jgi:hypothetical protein